MHFQRPWWLRGLSADGRTPSRPWRTCNIQSSSFSSRTCGTGPLWQLSGRRHTETQRRKGIMTRRTVSMCIFAVKTNILGYNVEIRDGYWVCGTLWCMYGHTSSNFQPTSIKNRIPEQTNNRRKRSYFSESQKKGSAIHTHLHKGLYASAGLSPNFLTASANASTNVTGVAEPTPDLASLIGNSSFMSDVHKTCSPSRPPIFFKAWRKQATGVYNCGIACV